MNITLLSINITTQPNARGGTYQIADVAYKNNTFQGKVEGKKVMSFGATEAAFKALAVAQPGESYDVAIEKAAGKDGKTYNNWVGLSKAGAEAPQAASSAGKPAPTSTPVRPYGETPEERAKRQTSIVRQSSLSNAINTLSVGAKKLTPDDVIAVAKQYEAFVNGTEFAGGATGFDDVPDFDPNFEVN